MVNRSLDRGFNLKTVDMMWKGKWVGVQEGY